MGSVWYRLYCLLMATATLRLQMIWVGRLSDHPLMGGFGIQSETVAKMADGALELVSWSKLHGMTGLTANNHLWLSVLATADNEAGKQEPSDEQRSHLNLRRRRSPVVQKRVMVVLQ